ncbi:MAG: hypothetical protein A2Y64_00515 [Candidatus Coatesbacteria bacterium RBG_13_66_14]|uniref:Curli production assembly/transport component CsgG n=1 Tax=Candidatus Coatesbacteria bacterium RBG_13_66_14 TaxID=1817816 RepID=A0A1F5EY38_9BACT|nr:MAG: hypothetical protein A2Y64_00515 [Candidatus Coatesbacteria bacterium RBG_13_66_14]
MRKLFIGLFMIVLAAGSLAAEKITVAFIGLEASGVSEASAGGIADTLLDALINTKRFEIVERERLNTLMEEQGLALSGCTTTECFVQVGQLAGASKVVVGKVSKVGETYTVTVRVVDVFVGKVELSESAESNSLDGLLSVARDMAARLAANIPVVGTVVSVSGETVKLDLGRKEGVKEGDTVELYRLGEEYYHPDTGAFLGRDIEELGEAKITRVLADELSEALYSGDVPPVTGDKVRLGGRIETGGHEAVTTTTTTVRPRGKGPGFGITLSAPFLFPINDLYGDYEDFTTKGIQFGGSLMVDFFIAPIFSLGPYFGLLIYDNVIECSDLYEEDTFLEMLFGLGLKVRFVETGTVRPWLFAGIGYALVSCDFYVEDYDLGDSWSNSFTGGSFGIDGGLGVDFWLSNSFSIGLGGLFHYNGVTEVEYETGETCELNDSLYSVGGLLDIGIYF